MSTGAWAGWNRLSKQRKRNLKKMKTKREIVNKIGKLPGRVCYYVTRADSLSHAKQTRQTHKLRKH